MQFPLTFGTGEYAAQVDVSVYPAGQNPDNGSYSTVCDTISGWQICLQTCTRAAPRRACSPYICPAA
jgi:hypothetical protein